MRIKATRVTSAHVFIAAMFACAGSCHATVYVADPGGAVPAFASHPPNLKYRLLISDEERPTRVPPSPPIKPPWAHNRSTIDHLIDAVAARHSVDADLVRAVVEIESQFNARAVSPKGAVGALQLMPGTARRFGVSEPGNRLGNLEGGVTYLKHLLVRYRGSVPLALAAYNAGEGAVARYRNGIPRYRETMLYVPQVLAAYARYREETRPRD